MSEKPLSGLLFIKLRDGFYTVAKPSMWKGEQLYIWDKTIHDFSPVPETEGV